MGTPDGRYWITYNGEVYNFRELREELRLRGHVFRSNGDTEVLLYLYRDEGPGMLDRLNGMFAFAIWDSKNEALFLARDRLGVKPLYYTLYENKLYFASEAKALFAAGVPVEFDHTTWGELLCFRYLAGDRTPFVGVQRLLAGHYLTWHAGQLTIRRWWNLGEKVKALRSRLPTDPARWFAEAFDDAVRIRRISDVPVGVLLSGGLDSSSVAASLAADAGPGVSSFTVRFDDPNYDEGPVAQQVVSRWGLRSWELVVDGDLPNRLRHAAWLSDEPLAHGNDLHLLAISQHAKPLVTVLLSGEGADETLGGYVRYRPLRYAVLFRLAQRSSAIARQFGRGYKRWAKLQRLLELGSSDRFILFNACEVLPADIAELGIADIPTLGYRERVLSEARTVYSNDLIRMAMYVDQHTFLCSVLDRNDRMTMGASIECRVPFLDYRLVEMAAALPSSTLFRGFQGKRLLRDSLGGRLPPAVLRHRKWGFGVPWGRYFRESPELRQLILDLPNAPLVRDSPLRRSVLRRYVDVFLAGDDRALPIVQQTLMTVLSMDAATSAHGRTRVAKTINSDVDRLGETMRKAQPL